MSFVSPYLNEDVVFLLPKRSIFAISDVKVNHFSSLKI